METKKEICSYEYDYCFNLQKDNIKKDCEKCKYYKKRENIELLQEKSPQEIADKLYELAKDMDYMDYEEEKEEVKADIENALYYLKAIAQNEYNADYFRTFWNILQRI